MMLDPQSSDELGYLRARRLGRLSAMGKGNRMVADPGIAPHPALAVAEDPALAAVRQITAGLTNAPLTDLPRPHPLRRWWVRGVETRRRALSLQDLANLDIEDIAHWFTAHYRCASQTTGENHQCYPGVVIGSINTAMTHVCTLTRIPWLPQTIMLPLQWEPRCWSSLPAAAAVGIQAAAAFHGRNPEVALHQSHDEWPGPAAGGGAPRMRAKLRRLPAAYVEFLDSSLAAAAMVILLQDESVWPATRLSHRHVLHLGSRHNPRAANSTYTVIPDGLSPDAEVGFDPDLGTDVARWCAARGRPLYRVRIRDASALGPAVAKLTQHGDRDPVPHIGDTLRVLSDHTEVTVQPAPAASTDQAGLWPTLMPRWRDHG
jgi:hypothetical protein